MRIQARHAGTFGDLNNMMDPTAIAITYNETTKKYLETALIDALTTKVSQQWEKGPGTDYLRLHEAYYYPISKSDPFWREVRLQINVLVLCNRADLKCMGEIRLPNALVDDVLQSLDGKSTFEITAHHLVSFGPFRVLLSEHKALSDTLLEFSIGLIPPPADLGIDW